MIALTSKWYYTKDAKSLSKFSCKGVRKKQNPMSWERFLEALNGSIDMTTNTGFRIHCHRIATYYQGKLGLSMYYDKHLIAPDGIHTELLR